jgi:hypothetical protein
MKKGGNTGSERGKGGRLREWHKRSQKKKRKKKAVWTANLEINAM